MLTPYAIGWLVLILLVFGVTKAVQSNEPSADPSDDDVKPEV